MKPKIGVMGAGVIGLSVARELALKGADVTLFESGLVGGWNQYDHVCVD